MIRLIVTLVLLVLSPAFVAPPPGADPSLAPWFRGLQDPVIGIPCCSVADCRPVKDRLRGDRYQAFIDRRSFGADAPDDWVDVPPATLLRGHDNPVGEAIACFYSGQIHCFVPGGAT